MKKKFLLFLLALAAGSLTAFSQVIISQVYEGTSNNKFIELTNIGSSAVDLASPQLSVQLFSNKIDIGTNTPTSTENLTGTLNAGQSMVLRHSSAVAPTYAVSYTPGITSGTCNFNGTGTASTDIIALYNTTTLQDVFAWGTFTYTDQSWYRNLAVNAPNATWTLSEWVQLTLADVDGALPSTPQRLGYHGAASTVPVLIITSPLEGSTVYGSSTNIDFTIYNFVIPTDGHIHYKLDGGADIDQISTNPIALTGLSTGAHTVILTLVDPASAPLNPSIADTVHFTVNPTVPNLKTIYQIQYTTDTSGNSPFMDSVVTTVGVVTASYAGGYFIQDGSSSWNGLYVYDNTHTPAEGDSILLTGTVSEYYKMTELKTITVYNLLGFGKPLPTPIAVTTTSVKDEQYESVLVKISNAVCTYVSATGWWKVLQSTDTCEIGKLMFSFPTAVVGEHYNVTGLVYFSYGAYVVDPRYVNDIELIQGIGENEQISFVAYPNPVSDKLTVELKTDYSYIRIFDVFGRLIRQVQLNHEKNVEIDMADLHAGCYFISMVKDGNVEGTRMIVKN